MNKILINVERNMNRICIWYEWNMNEIWMKYEWNMDKIWIKTGWNINETRYNHQLSIINLHDIWMRYADANVIWIRFQYGMNRTWMKYYWSKCLIYCIWAIIYLILFVLLSMTFQDRAQATCIGTCMYHESKTYFRCQRKCKIGK